MLAVAGALALMGLGETLYDLRAGVASSMPGGKRAIIRAAAIFGLHGSVALLPLWFPAPRRPPSAWRWAILGMAAVYVAYVAPLAWEAWRIDDPEWTSTDFGEAHPLWSRLSLPIIWMARVVALVVLIDLAHRARELRGAVRRQCVVLGLSCLTFWIVATIYASFHLKPQTTSKFWFDLIVLGPGTIALLLVALVVIAQNRTSRAETLLRRVIVVIGLVFGIYLIYKAIYVVLGALLVLPIATEAAVAAATAVLLSRPLAGFLWRTVDRLFYGRRARPYEAIRALGSRLRGQATDDEVAQVVCRTITEQLGLPGAALIAQTRAGERELARSGRVGAAPYRIALVHEGASVGALAIARREESGGLDARDRELLHTLADQIAGHVSALRFREELQASRERIVVSREAERRRLRRELHDGIGPALAAIRLRLEVAETQAPEALAPALRATAGEAASLVESVRRITDDLRPPELDDLGLVPALERLAERFGARFHAARPPLLAPATEVAAYRIAAEALHNAVRHAEPESIQLLLTCGETTLLVTVRDDGVGFAGEQRGGIGLDSMRERAEELGGAFTIVSPSGSGTEVRAELPLRTVSP
jgi:signal transduction histidine kinase